MWHIVQWIRWWLDCHYLYFNCEVSMCYTQLFIRSTSESYVLHGGSCTSIRLRRRRRSSHRNSTDCIFRVFFLSQLRREIQMTSWLRWTWFDYLSIFIAVAHHGLRENWNRVEHLHEKPANSRFVGYSKTVAYIAIDFDKNNNKMYKSRPVYLGRIFSQQLFVNCWKRTQFWRAI